MTMTNEHKAMRLGLLCSSVCPSAVIVHSLDLVMALANKPITLVSGFQSPVERECLSLLLKGSVHLVVCPARSAVGMRLPTAWKPALAAGRLTVCSAVDEGFEADERNPASWNTSRRPTAALAEHRNRFVALLSDGVLILHASPGGKLERLAADLLDGEPRRPVWTVGDSSNAALIAKGAEPLRSDAVERVTEMMGGSRR